MLGKKRKAVDLTEDEGNTGYFNGNSSFGTGNTMRHSEPSYTSPSPFSSSNNPNPEYPSYKERTIRPNVNPDPFGTTEQKNIRNKEKEEIRASGKTKRKLTPEEKKERISFIFRLTCFLLTLLVTLFLLAYLVISIVGLIKG